MPLENIKKNWNKLNNDQRVEFIDFLCGELGYVPRLARKKAVEICHLLALCDEHLESGCVINALPPVITFSAPRAIEG